MATEFSTLGKGNGFPFCLSESIRNGTVTVENEPTLAEAMSAYWNIDSITFGAASFNPNNEPKDLICSPDDVVGYDLSYVQNTAQTIEFYDVTISRPRILIIDGDKYLEHGVSFGYFYENYGSSSVSFNYESNSINYISTITYPLTQIPYTCTSGAYGFNFDQQTQTRTTETISGIPFNVVKSQTAGGYDYSASPACQPLTYHPLPTAVPQITLHNY